MTLNLANLKRWMICLCIALQAACGSQESANTDKSTSIAGLAGVNIDSTASNNVAKSPEKSDNKLLTSLATNYPNGQLPADRVAQAANDLAQNPAVLKMSAGTAPVAGSKVTAQSQPIQAQAFAADFQPVQRIQNTTLYGAYFFSIYPGEVTNALATNPNWSLEGPAFWASLQTGVDLYPVHRFQNKLNGSYLYTIYDTERADIVANYSATFVYEGFAWYARQTPAKGWSALYRFRSKTNGTYLFSAYESEKDAIMANYPDVFELEGIAYYVRQDVPKSSDVVVAGTAHTCAIKGDSTVACWGFNAYGQLGDGSTTQSLIPITVSGLSGVAALSAGFYNSCALKTEGTVVCWGYNANGQLGDGSTTQRLSPTAVPSLSGVAALSTGANHTCALKTDGMVACWGSNFNGSLGDGSTTNRLSPTAVSGLSGVAALSAGFYHTCALKTDGTVACWGDNLDGQLGHGGTMQKLNPTAVPGLSGVVALSAGFYHTCALKTNGTVACWGSNAGGQLGDGSTTDRLRPTAVPGLSGVATLSAGGGQTCALKIDETVACWGSNNNGQFGDGSITDRLNPTAVPRLSGVTALAAGAAHTCALKTDGTARCWGFNIYGQLGDGTTTNRSSNVEVLGGAVYWK
jgi:alpha-tubulin suppressor-like RCC1 family protein